MRTRKFSICLITLVLSLSAQCLRADLAGEIRQILSEKVLAKTTTGIEIVKLSDKGNGGQIIYERNAHLLLTPASNMKVLTTSSALHTLSPQFKFRTVLLKHGNDLAIWGDGDPTLGDIELMDKIGWKQTAVFEDWAGQLAKRGITSADNILIDDSIFDTEFLHPRWAKHQFLAYGSEIGGLTFNNGILDVLVQARKGGPAAWSTKPPTSYPQIVSNKCYSGGSSHVILARQPGSNEMSLGGTVAGTCELTVTIHDPPMYAATVFADHLKAKGFNLTGSVKRDRTTRQQYSAADTNARSQQWQVIGVFETPIAAVINRCNKDSMNQYAEMLCKRQGAAASGTSGTWANGIATTTSFLKQIGVPADEFRLDDGSGLSRDNEVTPNALARALMYDYYSPAKETMLNSLPIGGVDGTLHKRFDASLHGRVFAKTGFIANVSALSGYLHARSGDWYAFSIIMNDIPNLSNSMVKPLQDKIVKAIDNASVGQ